MAMIRPWKAKRSWNLTRTKLLLGESEEISTFLNHLPLSLAESSIRQWPLRQQVSGRVVVAQIAAARHGPGFDARLLGMHEFHVKKQRETVHFEVSPQSPAISFSLESW
jgi:hypothetical protein